MCQIVVVKIVSRYRFCSKWNILDNLYGFFRTDKWNLHSHFPCKYPSRQQGITSSFGTRSILSNKFQLGWSETDCTTPLITLGDPMCPLIHREAPVSICIRRGVLMNTIIQPIWWQSDLVFPLQYVMKSISWRNIEANVKIAAVCQIRFLCSIQLCPYVSALITRPAFFHYSPRSIILGLSSFYDLQDWNHITPHCLRNVMYFHSIVHVSSSRFGHSEAKFINHLQAILSNCMKWYTILTM